MSSVTRSGGTGSARYTAGTTRRLRSSKLIQFDAITWNIRFIATIIIKNIEYSLSSTINQRKRKLITKQRRKLTLLFVLDQDNDDKIQKSKIPLLDLDIALLD